MGQTLKDPSRLKTPLLVGGVAVAVGLGVLLWRRSRRRPGGLGAAVGRIGLGRGRRFEPRSQGRPVGRVDDYGPTQSATLYVGQDRGLQPPNKASRCARAPKRFRIKDLDDAFLTLRSRQVGREATGATRIKGKGWFEGKPEDAASYEVVYIPSNREQSYSDFRANMNALAEKLGKKLCQDSVIVVHNDGDRKQSCGAVWYEPGRGDCR